MYEPFVETNYLEHAKILEYLVYSRFITEYSRFTPVLFPAYLKIQLELLLYSRIIIFETLQDTWNFTEFFPKNKDISVYLSTYCDINTYKDFSSYYNPRMDVEPRTFWQMWLYQRSHIDFHTVVFWLYHYPVYVIPDSLIMLEFPCEYLVKHIWPYPRGIYELMNVDKIALDHHDYSTKYVLTTNYYTTWLAGNFNNHKNGLFICYYEPTSNWEAFVFPVPSYIIENHKPLYKWLVGDESMNIILATDYFKYYNKIRFYNDLKDWDWVKLMHDIQCFYLWKLPKN